MKTLNELAASMGLEALPSSGDLPIAELCMDSRKQEQQGLFFCISGARFDGPDGKDIVFDKDILGKTRQKDGAILPGPFAELKEGTNKILVWEEK